MASRILAKNVMVSNDTWETGLNNNDVIIGASGSGKSSGYVIPNIRQNEESMIIVDTKGMMYKQFKKELKEAGFEVQVLDFVNFEGSCSYNPLDYIEYDSRLERYREQDIVTAAQAMVPKSFKREPFWEESAAQVMESLIAFVLEGLQEAEKNMLSVAELYKVLSEQAGTRLFEELEAEKPYSFAVQRFLSYKNVFRADRTWGSISQFLSNTLEVYDFQEVRNLLEGKRRFRFEDLGRKKMVLFVNVSDTDRAFDHLVNVFYTQAIHCLCKEADSKPNGRLKVPVRIVLDDFANHVYIPDFDRLISVIRSRELSVSVILQSISQLETLYTPAQATTILNGCDHLLYLGGQDVKTADYISLKIDCPIDDILNMGLDDAYLFERGSKPRHVEKINLYA
ncbi:MAG: type IV secretory system conjugative DNA transfer family protein [Clostridium sp.]|nr:type IV secretory system conjugative DNA transfer family protein [Clostridium sp.]